GRDRGSQAPLVRLLGHGTVLEDDLFPAFGEVTRVDWLRGRILARLLESPFGPAVAIPMREADVSGAPDLPEWMLREGALFEAQATSSEGRPENFYIGRFEQMDEGPDQT